MKTGKITVLLILVLYSLAMGTQTLRINSEDVSSVTLKSGEIYTIQVISDNSASYVDYIGFDNAEVLGTFVHTATYPAAGDLATVYEYDVPEFYGFRVSAGALPPSNPDPGVHFVFTYIPDEVGQTNLYLYDDLLAAIKDSIHITVIPDDIGSAFTYQGRLFDANTPGDDFYDFQFGLFDSPDPVLANQLGDTLSFDYIPVVDGYFTLNLDFGPGLFDGDPRWLGISVRPWISDDPCDFVNLQPRQEIKPAPYALYAKTSGSDGDDDWQINGSNMYSIPSGSIGIGKTNPTAKLDINGNINIDSDYKIGGDTVLSNWGAYNLFVGVGRGENNIGMYNTFVGDQTGVSNTDGDFNTFLGQSTGLDNTSGCYNTFAGYVAGRENITGCGNTFLGMAAGYHHEAGIYNTFLGYGAGYSNITGEHNVFLGFQAGYNETGSDKLYIANGRNDPNVLIYGEFDTGNVGIGTTTPSEMLEINGAIELGNTTSSPPDPGTIRWTGTDFEGYNGTEWVSLTAGNTIPSHGTQMFTSDGTFIVPEGVTLVYLTMIGGGGGGGGTLGGGGGAGQCYINNPFTVVPGNSYGISIGLGGNGYFNDNGGNGGDTIFDTGGTPLVASGGNGGEYGNSNPGGAGYSNLDGQNGDEGGNGGYNMSIVTGSGGDSSINNGGGGGASPYGTGGDGGVNQTPGENASGYGAGGGGGGNGVYDERRAGDGSPGFCLVIW
ncbi:MAG: hypothetical protein JW860_16095 [Sedimentisphaerales bacterium]|nr:hypothetical protein [Sedimentisphaerales bacterium]